MRRRLVPVNRDVQPHEVRMLCLGLGDHRVQQSGCLCSLLRRHVGTGLHHRLAVRVEEHPAVLVELKRRPGELRIELEQELRHRCGVLAVGHRHVAHLPRLLLPAGVRVHLLDLVLAHVRHGVVHRQIEHRHRRGDRVLTRLRRPPTTRPVRQPDLVEMGP